MKGTISIHCSWEVEDVTKMHLDYCEYYADKTINMIAEYRDLVPMTHIIARWMPKGYRIIKTVAVPSPYEILHIRVIVTPILEGEFR